MIPDRLQYFLEHFWIAQKSTKSGPSEPVFITKILQTIQENMGTFLKRIILVNMENNSFDAFWKCLKSLCTILFEMLSS